MTTNDLRELFLDLNVKFDEELKKYTNTKTGGKADVLAFPDSIEETEKLIKEQERIQANLTEKFLRTFLRLSEQYNNLNITAYPYEIDSYLSLEVAGRLTSENKLLNDISISITNNVKHL